MANGCRLNIDTVTTALNFLVDRNLVKKVSRPGRSSNLKANPHSIWRPIGNEGVGGNEGSPLISQAGTGKEGVATEGKRGGTKLLPEVSPNKVSAIPILSPIKHGMFPREYDALISDATEQLKKAKEKFTELVLNNNGISYMKWLEENESNLEERERKIKIGKADKSNFKKQLMPEGKAHIDCWTNRIEEIKRAKRGEQSSEDTNPRNVGMSETAAEKSRETVARLERRAASQTQT